MRVLLSSARRCRGLRCRALVEAFGQRIVWISALGREDFSLSTLLDEIATQLGHPELRTLAPAAKTEAVQALIASAPTLVILDNFETIKPDEQTRCVEFLLDHATCPALITTRQKIASARNVVIPVMAPDEAADFLDRLIEQASDKDAFAQLDRERIMIASDRNPLVLQWVVAQIDLAQEANTVLDDLNHGVGDAAKSVFDRSFGLEQLGDDGRAVLLALSLFAPDASRNALAEAAGFGKEAKRLNEAVKCLATLWLVKTTAAGRRLAVEGLTREFAKARLSRDDRAVRFTRRFVTYFRGYAVANTRNFEALEAEKENLLNAIDRASRVDDLGSVMTICTKLTNFLDQRDFWEDEIRSGKQALSAARKVGRKAHISAFLHSLGLLHRRRGELDEARRLLSESLDILRTLGKPNSIASTLRQLARVAQDKGDLGEALRLYNESLAISKKNLNLGGMANTLRQLGRLAHQKNVFPEAQRFYRDSLAIDREVRNERGIANTQHDLARLAQDKGELNEARLLYNESLEIMKRLGSQGGIAKSLHQLGRLAEEESNNADAAQLFGEALAIFERLKSPHAEAARQSLDRVTSKLS